ncbi:MAG TPA: glucose-6-phosphate dehydrogenase assembly protein OpcA [Candidatus Dormibacteraeota bacterium]
MTEGLTTSVTANVHQIQEELERVRWGLHDDDGQYSEAAEHAAAEARASVLNLITVVMDESQLASVKRVLEELSITNPSRTFLLLAQPHHGGEKLEAEVSAQTRTETGHRVTTEQVTLHAHGDVATHLASVVTPLLISELPVVIWWPGLPTFDSRLFDDLCEIADRLIVDTDEGFEREHLARLLEVARRAHAQAQIGDFNWARLVAWRHVTAQYFDMPGMLPRLAQIEGVRIAYGAERPVAAAWLLAGWLKSRLATAGISFPVEFLEDGAHDHRVARLDIYTRGTEGAARFTVRRIPGGRLCADLRVGDQDYASRTVAYTQRSPQDLLAFELTLPGHDLLFEEALAAAIS